MSSEIIFLFLFLIPVVFSAVVPEVVIRKIYDKKYQQETLEYLESLEEQFCFEKARIKEKIIYGSFIFGGIVGVSTFIVYYFNLIDMNVFLMWYIFFGFFGIAPVGSSLGAYLIGKHRRFEAVLKKKRKEKFKKERKK